MPWPWGPDRNRLDVMPSFLAISAVSFTPTSRMSWANTVFTDLAVATRRFIEPPPSPSAALWIWQFAGLRGSRHPGMVYTLGAAYVFAGGDPLAEGAGS